MYPLTDQTSISIYRPCKSLYVYYVTQPTYVSLTRVLQYGNIHCNTDCSVSLQYSFSLFCAKVWAMLVVIQILP